MAIDLDDVEAFFCHTDKPLDSLVSALCAELRQARADLALTVDDDETTEGDAA